MIFVLDKKERVTTVNRCFHDTLLNNYDILLLLYMYKRAAEEDVEAQRQELVAGFDDALRKREHEFRKKADDLSNAALASELKVCSMQSLVLCQRTDVKLCYLPFKEAFCHD